MYYCALLLLTSTLKVDGSRLAASTTHLKYTPMSSTFNCVGGVWVGGLGVGDLWASEAEEEAASMQLSMSIVR